MEQVSLVSDSTMAALLDYYGISYERAHILVVNRQMAALDTVLRDGDDIRILPLAAGG